MTSVASVLCLVFCVFSARIVSLRLMTCFTLCIFLPIPRTEDIYLDAHARLSGSKLVD